MAHGFHVEDIHPIQPVQRIQLHCYQQLLEDIGYDVGKWLWVLLLSNDLIIFLFFLFLSFFYILAHAALLKTSFSLAESDGHFSITLLCQQKHTCNLSKVFKTAFGVIDLHRQTNTDDMKAVFFFISLPCGCVCDSVCVCLQELYTDRHKGSRIKQSL